MLRWITQNVFELHPKIRATWCSICLLCWITFAVTGGGGGRAIAVSTGGTPPPKTAAAAGGAGRGAKEAVTAMGGKGMAGLIAGAAAAPCAADSLSELATVHGSSVDSAGSRCCQLGIGRHTKQIKTH